MTSSSRSFEERSQIETPSNDLTSLALSSETEDSIPTDEDDMKSLLDEKHDPAKRRRNRLQIIRAQRAFLPSIILQKRLITLRSVLLALSLTLTLGVFWLLDSLKDPTLTILVNGNLKKHQPLAKMASVGGTLVLVVLMELISHERDKRRALEAAEKTMGANEVLEGGGQWTRMDIDSGENCGRESDNKNSDSRIPIHIFKTVGLSYIAAFGTISWILRYHHGFLKSDEVVDVNVAWHILGYVQYITIESFGSIGVATFWSFANSTLTLKAAKTYYGFIIAMAQIGAFGGSTVATIQSISVPNLYLIACFGILMQIGVMQIYGQRFPHVMNQDDDEAIDDSSEFGHEGADISAKVPKSRQQHQDVDDTIDPDETMSYKVLMSGVFLILKHNYLLLILGVSCLYEISLTCLDYEMKLIGLDRFRAPPDFLEDSSIIDPRMNEEEVNAFTTFMGRYGQLTNVLSLLLSYYAFPYLMENFGLKHTLRIFPTLLLAIATMTFIALPMNLPVLFISMSLLKALTYSINDPAKEILYIPTSNTVKFKAKFWIDVVGARVAKAIGSSINTYAGTAERIVQYGSLPSAVTALALWVICYAAGIKFDSLLETGEIVGNDEDKIQKDILIDGNDSNYQDNFFEGSDDEDIGNDSQSDWRSDASIELQSLN